MKKETVLIIAVVLVVAMLVPTPLLAKRSKKKKAADKAPAVSEVLQRINFLSDDDKRRFNDLSDEQRQKITNGRIDNGFNAWMVKLALGEPFYGTEHSPIFTDYEEVWLYTKPDVTQDITKERIIDSQTNWPTIHRVTRKKTCNVSDFFVLWDRGVVQAVHTATDKKVHGSCTIETSEAFLPIVDGKPVEPKQ